MKKIFAFFVLVLILFCNSAIYSQISYNTFVASVMNQVNTDSVYKFERQLTGDTACMIGGSVYTITTRHYSTQGNIKAAQYILERFQSFGLTAWYQTINSTMVNVLAKKTGNTFPNQYVIICAHYDDMPSGALAPGADDNASGTVAVIEAARLMSVIDLPYTILFAAWDEEERGLLGSKAYADSAFTRGDSIIGVLNFDMIAYDGNNDGALDVNTNPGSMSLASEFQQVVNLYQPSLVPQITTSLNGGSDHQPFQQKGYKAILSIEDNNDFTPFYHTVNDAYSSLNKPYFVKMVKAGIASLVTTAGGFNHATSIAGNINSLPGSFELRQNYPNPFNPVTNLEFGISDLGFVSLKVYDILGKEIITLVNEKLNPGNYKVEFDGSSLTSGAYYYRLTAGEFTDVKEMLLVK